VGVSFKNKRHTQSTHDRGWDLDAMQLFFCRLIYLISVHEIQNDAAKKKIKINIEI